MISKYTKIPNKKKEKQWRRNNTNSADIQTEITTEVNKIENLKVLLEEKEHKINILEETQSKIETTISLMKEEIKNYENGKKSKQTQLNKKQKKYMQKTKQYRIMKISVVDMK